MEQPIQKTSISQQVVDYILERINCGAWRPGDRLLGEREFAETLGISRVPLREAISALCAIGILERRQGDGTFVAFFSPQVLGRLLRTYTMLDATLSDNLFEARLVVEGAAARLAARNARPEDVEELQVCLRDMEEAVPAYIRGEKTLADMLALDDLFHLRCAAASHNQFYIQFVSIVHSAGTDMGLYEAAYGKNRARYYQSLEFHRRIVDAIATANPQRAEAVMCRHIESIRANTRQGDDEINPEEPGERSQVWEES